MHWKGYPHSNDSWIDHKDLHALTHCQTSTFQTPLWLDDLQYKEALETPKQILIPHFILATYTYYYRPSLKRIFQIFENDPIFQFFQYQTCHLCPFKQLLALSSLAMSCSSSPIFIPSRLSSPTNSAGHTPYIVTSPPPNSPTSDEMALPHKQMIEHIAHLLNIEEDEVRHQFPTVFSLLPIDRSPPTPTSVLTPDTLMLAHISTIFNDIDNYEGIPLPTSLSYPGTEFEHYNDPTFPNSPPIPSPEPLPIPPPHFHDSISITPPVTSATNSTYTLPVIPTFIEEVVSHSPSSISPMAMVLYQQMEANKTESKAMDADAKGCTPSPNGSQPGVFPSPGWKDNFTATRTCHFFVIPDGEEDVIAPFISYDLDTIFPELLATNSCGCTVHSCPLHACPIGQHHTFISPKDELLLTKAMQFTDLVDWALTKEDDATLQGEV